MGTTGTYSFNLDIEQILSQAMEWAGGELATAKDLKDARKALSLVLIDMQNRGHPLAELENKTFTVASASSSYTLSAGVIDILDMVVVRSSVATPVERIALLDYHKIPTKTQKGLPTQYAVDRDRDAITVHLYLTPENSTDTIDYWCFTEIEDVGTNYSNTLDINKRYLPALTFGTAYYIAMGRKPSDEMTLQDLIQKRTELKQQYETLLPQAALEDSERASLIISPFGYHR